MKTDRRSFLKSAGLLTAAAAVLNPATIFAQAERGKKRGFFFSEHLVLGNIKKIANTFCVAHLYGRCLCNIWISFEIYTCSSYLLCSISESSAVIKEK